MFAHCLFIFTGYGWYMTKRCHTASQRVIAQICGDLRHLGDSVCLFTPLHRFLFKQSPIPLNLI